MRFAVLLTLLILSHADVPRRTTLFTTESNIYVEPYVYDKNTRSIERNMKENTRGFDA